MNRSRKGRRLEHRTMRWLEAQGYVCVRAAASLGAWDVVAIRKDGVRLIQVKANRGPGSVEREQLQCFACPDNCAREIWIWRDRAREPSVEVL